jgi:hypothetical protein
MTEKPPQQQQPRVGETKLNKETIRGLWMAVLAPAIAFPIVCLYVGAEAPGYWSDFNFYEWATRFSISQLQQSPLTYPLFLYGSISLNHNLLFTVPLVPLMVLLGGTRLAFIASITMVYFLPLAYLIARLAKTITIKSSLSTAQAFFVVLTLPVLWAAPLRGYPDCSAALILMLCLLLYLNDRSWQNVRRGATIGFLLALTVLLRRYFAFAGVTLVLSILVDQALLLRQQGRKHGSHQGSSEGSTQDITQGSDDLLAKKVKTTVALIGAGLLTMVTLGFLFLQNLSRTNFGALYESYHVSPAGGAAYFFSCFGLFILLVSASGFYMCWRQGLVDRAKMLFVLCFYLTAQTIWICGPDELGTHYTLYFSPFVALGMVLNFCAAVNLPISKSKKAALVLTTALLLLLNLCLSLLPAQIVDKTGLILFRPGMLSLADQEGKGPALFFSGGYAPYCRGDLDTLKSIITFLRSKYKGADETGQNSSESADSPASFLDGRGQVCVAACSTHLNFEQLRNVERSMFGLNHDKIEWLELPLVDSKDSYPLEGLLACRYLLLPTQNQYFLAPEGQKIIAAVKACFDEKWPLAQDFRELPQTFILDGGVKVNVFERLRPSTPATAALTLEKMKSFIGKKQGSQPAWITTGKMSRFCYDNRRSQWQFKPGLSRPGVFSREDRYLLYVGQLPNDFYISGRLSASTKVPMIIGVKAQVLRQDGQLLYQTDLATPGKVGEKGVTFCQHLEHLSRPDGTPKYMVLLVEITQQSVPPGVTITLDDIRLEATPPPKAGS